MENIFDLKNRYTLKYDFSFLSKAITEKQLETHYKEHLIGYYNNLDILVQSLNLVDMSSDLVKLVQNCFGKQDLIQAFNNAGQIINHIYYFESFVEKEIKKDRKEALKLQFPDLDSLISQTKSIVDKHGFGSSWLWIAFDKSNAIKIFVTPNAFTVHNIDFIQEVVCCIDLWEHAYYIDYTSKRSDYLKNILSITNLAKQIY